MKQLDDKRVCCLCTAWALAVHAAILAEHTMGRAEAIEMLEDIIRNLREDAVLAPDRSPSAAAQ